MAQVLDFSAVVGVDATATRSCFLMLVQLMRSANVAVVFANMTHSLEALFRAHKVQHCILLHVIVVHLSCLE